MNHFNRWLLVAFVFVVVATSPYARGNAVLQKTSKKSKSAPFYVTLAPGDKVNGKANKTSGYEGEVPLKSGDVISTGSGANGPSILHLGQGHVYTILPNTILKTMPPDKSTAPGSVPNEHVFLSRGGVLVSSGSHSGRTTSADVPEPINVGSSAPVQVKTNGGTTGTTGSTFLLVYRHHRTVVDLFDCQRSDIVTRDGHRYHHDGLHPIRLVFRDKGEISRKW